MKFVIWVFRGVVFLALLGLAIKNSDTVALRFYLDGVWQVPLSLLILITFTLGAVVGLTATVITLVRQRRELRQLRNGNKPADSAP